MSKPNDIDIGLEILCAVSMPGQTWSGCEIAEVCGCTTNYIYELEKNALKKLQKKLNRDDCLELLQ